MEVNLYEGRQFMIFNVSEMSKINFNEVCETSAETLRKSSNGEKTFVKWDGDTPQCIYNLIEKEGPYTHSEMLEILSGMEWNHINDNPIIEI